MIPTAEEIFILETSEFTKDKLEDWEKQHILDAMIELTKIHVTEALKQASEIVHNEIEKDFLTKESILNAYNLKNIK